MSLDQPCRDAPGKEFDYVSGSTQIMSEVLEAAYGKPLDVLVREDPGGRSVANTMPTGAGSGDGDFKAFCCLYATARHSGWIKVAPG